VPKSREETGEKAIRFLPFSFSVFFNRQHGCPPPLKKALIRIQRPLRPNDPGKKIPEKESLLV
jgi:hypothetical protein